jgi:hypothetical protein
MKPNRISIMITLVVLGLLTIAVAVPRQRAMAATCASQVASGFWNSTSTWDCAVVPGPGDVVTITSGNTISLDISTSIASLTIDGSLSFSGSNSLIVNGDVTIDAGGSLTLGTAAGGDLSLTGNWSNAGTFAPNGRKVTFNGTAAAQTIDNSSSFFETFDYLAIDNTSGFSIQLLAPVYVQAASGVALDLLNGNIDLNNSVLTVNGDGDANIRVCNAAHQIVDTAGAGLLVITSNFAINTKTVITTGCTPGSLVIGTTATLNVNHPTDLDYTRFDPGNGLTTINGTLLLNYGGRLVTNSPFYGPASLLDFELGATYALGTEWGPGATPATAGVPYKVTVGSINTKIQFANDTSRTVYGDINLSYGKLQLSGSCSAACALSVRGNWLNSNGDLIAGVEEVIFNGVSKQYISPGSFTTFYDLRINNVGGLQLQNGTNVNHTLTLQTGLFDIDTFNLSMSSNANITYSGAAYSVTKMIIAHMNLNNGGSAGGYLCKTFTVNSGTPINFFFPIGDNVAPGGNNYSPFDMTLPAGNYSNYTICTRVGNFKHYKIGSNVTIDYIVRYWDVTSDTAGTGVGTFDGTFYYNTVDVVGTEANMFGARFQTDTQIWEWYNPVNTVTHSFSVSGITMPPEAYYTALPKGGTAATVLDMAAVPSSGQVYLRWKTGMEVDLAGFKVYRSTSSADKGNLLTPALLPSQMPGQPAGASYAFTDATAQVGVTYYYWIEGLDTHNESTFYAPMEVTWDHIPTFMPLTLR